MCRTLPLTKSALDTLLAAVCGDDTDASPADGETKLQSYKFCADGSGRD